MVAHIQKPHLRYDSRAGVWFCYGWLSFGVGFSPKAAADAHQVNENAARERAKISAAQGWL